MPVSEYVLWGKNMTTQINWFENLTICSESHPFWFSSMCSIHSHLPGRIPYKCLFTTYNYAYLYLRFCSLDIIGYRVRGWDQLWWCWLAYVWKSWVKHLSANPRLRQVQLSQSKKLIALMLGLGFAFKVVSVGKAWSISAQKCLSASRPSLFTRTDHSETCSQEFTHSQAPDRTLSELIKIIGHFTYFCIFKASSESPPTIDAIDWDRCDETAWPAHLVLADYTNPLSCPQGVKTSPTMRILTVFNCLACIMWK